MPSSPTPREDQFHHEVPLAADEVVLAELIAVHRRGHDDVLVAAEGLGADLPHDVGSASVSSRPWASSSANASAV